MVNPILLQPTTEPKISKVHFVPSGASVDSGVLTACIGVCLFGGQRGKGYGRHFYPNEIREQLPGLLSRAICELGDFEVYVAGSSVNYSAARLLGLTDPSRIDSTRDINADIKKDVEIIVDRSVPRERSFISWLPEDTHARIYGNNALLSLRIERDLTFEVLYDGDAKKSPYLRA